MRKILMKTTPSLINQKQNLKQNQMMIIVKVVTFLSTHQHVDIEERTEVLGNKRVTFNIPCSSEENTSTGDVDTSSEENNFPVISEKIQLRLHKGLNGLQTQYNAYTRW